MANATQTHAAALALETALLREGVTQATIALGAALFDAKGRKGPRHGALKVTLSPRNTGKRVNKRTLGDLAGIRCYFAYAAQLQQLGYR